MFLQKAACLLVVRMCRLSCSIDSMWHRTRHYTPNPHEKRRHWSPSVALSSASWSLDSVLVIEMQLRLTATLGVSFTASIEESTALLVASEVGAPSAS